MDDEPVNLYEGGYQGSIQNIRPQSQRLYDRAFRNILTSGLVLCLVYSAFFPGGGLLAVVIEDGTTGLGADVGFYSQAITYISSIMVALASPFLISIIGIRASLGLGSILYVTIFIGTIFLKAWTIYLGSVITGMGMGLLWVAAPKVLADNSTEATIRRNSSLWWCIYISSMVFGNLADYFYLGGLSTIDTNTRICIYTVCCGLIVLATLTGVFGYKDIDSLSENEDLSSFLCSRSIDSRRSSLNRINSESSLFEKFKAEMERWKITLLRREVGYLCVLLVYNAVCLAFYTMTYQTCIGNTFSSRDLIALMALIFGFSEVLACPIFETAASKFGIKSVAIVLHSISLTAFYLVFLIFPPNSTHESVLDVVTIVKPSSGIVIAIAVLLAVQDSGFNIIATTTIGIIFQSDSDIGFMLLNGVMSLGTGVMFLISSYLDLYIILGISVLLCTSSTLLIVLDLFKR